MYDHTVQNTGAARIIWKTIMEEYLKDKEAKEFTFSPNVISATYCKETGDLAVSAVIHIRGNDSLGEASILIQQNCAERVFLQIAG